MDSIIFSPKAEITISEAIDVGNLGGIAPHKINIFINMILTGN